MGLVNGSISILSSKSIGKIVAVGSGSLEPGAPATIIG